MRRWEVGDSWPCAIRDVLIGPDGAGAKGGPKTQLVQRGKRNMGGLYHW